MLTRNMMKQFFLIRPFWFIISIIVYYFHKPILSIKPRNTVIWYFQGPPEEDALENLLFRKSSNIDIFKQCFFTLIWVGFLGVRLFR